MKKKRIRVLVAKPGLDGHDRGVKVVARALSDAGMEVIYTGLRQSVKQIVETAIQEDVDVIGLSCLSGGHIEVFSELGAILKERDVQDILVVGGGIIPEKDVPVMKESCDCEVFGPGTPMDEIIHYIENRVYNKRAEPDFS